MPAKDKLILYLMFQLSLAVIVVAKKLKQQRKYNLANQLFRSGRLSGANVREAQGCESKADFLHNMKIAYQEAEETKYRLEPCLHSGNYPTTNKWLESLALIRRVPGKIISSAKSIKPYNRFSHTHIYIFAHLHIFSSFILRPNLRYELSR